MPYYRVLISMTPSITGEAGTHDLLSLFVDGHDIANTEEAARNCIRDNYNYCTESAMTIAPAHFEDMEQKPMERPFIHASLAGTCWLLDCKTGCGWDWSMVNWASSCSTFDSFRLFSTLPNKKEATLQKNKELKPPRSSSAKSTETRQRADAR